MIEIDLTDRRTSLHVLLLHLQHLDQPVCFQLFVIENNYAKQIGSVDLFCKAVFLPSLRGINMEGWNINSLTVRILLTSSCERKICSAFCIIFEGTAHSTLCRSGKESLLSTVRYRPKREALQTMSDRRIPPPANATWRTKEAQLRMCWNRLGSRTFVTYMMSITDYQ